MDEAEALGEAEAPLEVVPAVDERLRSEVKLQNLKTSGSCLAVA
jgi:hypothetical protein